ncbi:hypothetical protein JOD20_001624 [Herpetosiphon giganteus]|nr:hypothetical protein [Herpetosiphon giganteus]
MDATLRKSQRQGNLLLVGLCMLLLSIGLHLGHQLAYAAPNHFNQAYSAVQCHYLCKIITSE